MRKTGNPDKNNNIIQQCEEMNFGIEKCAMLIMKSGKGELATRTELSNQEYIRTPGKKENYQYLGILQADAIRQAKMKKKKKKKGKITSKNEKTSRNKSLQQKSHKSDKHLGRPSCKILVTILYIEKEGAQTNWSMCCMLTFDPAKHAIPK